MGAMVQNDNQGLGYRLLPAFIVGFLKGVWPRAFFALPVVFPLRLFFASEWLAYRFLGALAWLGRIGGLMVLGRYRHGVTGLS